MKSLFLFLLFLSFLETVQSQVVDGYCMVKFKEKMENAGTAFFWARQKTLEACKNLCMVRKDCISMDWGYDNQECRLFKKKGFMYLKNSGSYSSTIRNVDAFIKYPTTNCGDSAQLEQAFMSNKVVTNADGSNLQFQQPWGDPTTAQWPIRPA
ncbi:unnamed protein product [Caenorhabditis nigoni]